MKFRTQTEHRTVPVERDGTVHLVNQEVKVRIPRAPRDVEAVVLRAVYTGVFATVAVAVAWSTVAIGDLLSGVAPPWASYMVAGGFDLAWIVCMALEWLSRYDKDRAFLPVVCGWIALVVSASLISYHGYLGGSVYLGACGGAVSVLAKGMWTVVMRHSSVEMDPDSKAWLRAERASVNSVLAVVGARRQLARTQARTDEEALALSHERLSFGMSWLSPGQSSGTGTVPVSPELSSGTGQDKAPVQDRTLPPVSVSRDSGQDSPPLDMTGRLSQRAFVRGLLSADNGLSNEALSTAVRSEYGPDTKADSIRKAIARARDDLSLPA